MALYTQLLGHIIGNKEFWLNVVASHSLRKQEASMGQNDTTIGAGFVISLPSRRSPQPMGRQWASSPR